MKITDPKTVDGALDWCLGCETPERTRINLPADWKEGDPLPDGLTIHGTAREGYRFAFRGDPLRGDRVKMP